MLLSLISESRSKEREIFAFAIFESSGHGLLPVGVSIDSAINSTGSRTYLPGTGRQTPITAEGRGGPKYTISIPIFLPIARIGMSLRRWKFESEVIKFDERLSKVSAN